MTGVSRVVSLRLRGALPLDQQSRAERSLALARAFIAIAALVALSISAPSPSQSHQVAYLLLIAYIAFAFSAIFLLHLRPQLWKFSAVAVHMADVAVAGGVTIFTS